MMIFCEISTKRLDENQLLVSLKCCNLAVHYHLYNNDLLFALIANSCCLLFLILLLLTVFVGVRERVDVLPFVPITVHRRASH